MNGVSPTLRVCALYPDLMNIYADRGNLLMLERRCRWRGIAFELSGPGVGDELTGEEADLYYIGGGQDRDQALCAEDLAGPKRAPMHAAVDRGAIVLAVCGGYQLLGHEYQLGEQTLPGAGLIDIRTVRGDGKRLIGNVAIETDLPGVGPHTLAGFENHGGRTHLGPAATPLGRVLRGHGNNGVDGYEGVISGSVIGTYLHGPLLPKNTWFADWLIATALGSRPGSATPTPITLEPLDDQLEDLAHLDACKAAGL